MSQNLPIHDISAGDDQFWTIENHGSNIFFIDGKLLVVWFHGGERDAAYSEIYASSADPATYEWQPLTKIADNGDNGTVPNYPDINPAFNYDTTTREMLLCWMMTTDGTWASAQIRMRLGKDNGTFETVQSISWQMPIAGEILRAEVESKSFLDATASLYPNTWPLLAGEFEPIRSFVEAPAFSSCMGQNEAQLDIDPAAIDAMVAELIERTRDFDDTFLGDVKQEIASKYPKYTPILERLTKFSNIGLVYIEFQSSFSIGSLIAFLYTVFDTYCLVLMRLTVFNIFNPGRYHRGWETRCQLQTITREDGSTRLLLPLYSDTLNLSVVFYSDDEGRTWSYPKTPISGRATIQPSIVQHPSGKLTAFLRNNGGFLYLDRPAISESCDYGLTWTPTVPMLNHFIQNQSSSLAALALKNSKYDTSLGPFVLVYTPDEERQTLFICVGFLGTSNGINNKPIAWVTPICLEGSDGSTSYGYPSVTEGDDGTLYISCSHHYQSNGTDFQKKGIIQYDGLKS
ncbi:exo-alpha-sialidase [Martelella soudanensis]|uniref:exo-alpha-sialidase n=1 Tax=unclassified Martelella TaxID=2629616 RepID=UPI0015DE0D1A|nr:MULTISPECIES: exo-alpha-sialidase [unclassified Martelella]